MWKSKPLLFTVTGFLVLTIGSGVLYGLQSFNRQDVKDKATSLSPTISKLVARLEIFSEPVGVSLPGQKGFVAAEENMIIPEGTIIKTGAEGRAQIVFPGGTVTRVDFDSIVRVKQFDPQPQNIFIEILQGRIWSRIKKLFGNESYQSSGGTMVASVRGTSYGHGLLPNEVNRGSVLKGTVEMKCVNGSNEATLSENMLAEVNCITGKGFTEDEVYRINMEDEWVQFNREQDEVLDERFGEKTYDEDNVLGVTSDSETVPTVTLNPTLGLRGTNTPRPTSSPRPTPTVKGRTPTPVPTTVTSSGATNTPVQANTTAPTFTPTPTPTTSVPAPFIEVVNYDPGLLGSIAGGIIQSATIDILGGNFENAQVAMSGSSLTGIRENTPNKIRAVFSSVTCGSHTVSVTTPGGSVTGKIDINPPVCLRLGL